MWGNSMIADAHVAAKGRGPIISEATADDHHILTPQSTFPTRDNHTLSGVNHRRSRDDSAVG